MISRNIPDGSATFTLLLALLVAPMAEANSWHWPRGGHPAGNSPNGSGSDACNDARELLDDRDISLSNGIDALNAQLSGASGPERRQLIRQIRFLEARGNLLDVADRRLSRGRASDKKCALVEAFLQRLISPS